MSVDILKKRKIAVLGSRSVGKSSLVVQFVEDHFVDSYYPTIENTFSKSVKFKGIEYECDIIDTAGQDEFTILNSHHAIGIHGFILVYSVASRSSFDMVQIIYDKIINFTGTKSVPCVIVGAKADLDHSTVTRQIQTKEADEFAHEIGASFTETSAKMGKNINNVFELCLGEIEKRNPRNQGAPDGQRCIIM